MMKSGILAVLFVFIAFTGACAAERFSRHFDDSLFKITEKKMFSVEIVTERKGLRIGKDAVGIIIHNAKDEDVERAHLQVSVNLLQGASASYAVTEKGDGLYIVKNLNLKKEGKWELAIKIRKGKSEDSVVFGFQSQ